MDVDIFENRATCAMKQVLSLNFLKEILKII